VTKDNPNGRKDPMTPSVPMSTPMDTQSMKKLTTPPVIMCPNHAIYPVPCPVCDTTKPFVESTEEVENDNFCKKHQFFEPCPRCKEPKDHGDFSNLPYHACRTCGKQIQDSQTQCADCTYCDTYGLCYGCGEETDMCLCGTLKKEGRY